MKKFFSLFLAAGLMFPAALVASAGESSGSSSSGSASSSGEAAVQNDSVILVARGTKIELSQELVGLLGSLTIETALQSDMQESRTREFDLSDEFDAATVQTIADILIELVKTGSIDKSVAQHVSRENVLPILGLLDYLQAEQLENAVFGHFSDLFPNLAALKFVHVLFNRLAQMCPNVVDKIFTQRAILPNLQLEKTFAGPGGHADRVSSVSYSPDGKSLASGSGDNTVKIWDVTSGACLKTLAGLDGHAWGVFSVSYSPDGKSLASGGGDYTVKIWDVTSGACLKTLAGLDGHAWGVFSVSYSPDGKSLASGSGDRTVKIWDVTSGECIKTLKGHADSVWSVSYSPDGKSLASGSSDKTVKIWDVESGICIKTLEGHTSYVSSVSYSPDGKNLASGSGDHTVKIWDVESGVCLKTLTGHTNGVWSVSYSPDGKSLASGSYDRTVNIWGNRELAACAPLQKLFILINLQKKSGIFERATLWFAKLIERVGLRADDHKQIALWAGVYQSLPEQAKKILDKDVREKYENFLWQKWFVGATVGERRVVRKLVPVQGVIARELACKQANKLPVGYDLAVSLARQNVRR